MHLDLTIFPLAIVAAF